MLEPRRDGDNTRDHPLCHFLAVRVGSDETKDLQTAFPATFVARTKAWLYHPIRTMMLSKHTSATVYVI